MRAKAPRKSRGGQEANGGVESVKRSSAIYETLRKDIITGAIPDGEPLAEAQLAARFGCSQAPVREACIGLLHDGFLATTPYKGFSVREITLAEIKDLYQARVLVECAAAEAAAGAHGAGPEIIDELEGHVRVQREGGADLWRYLSAEAGFHLAIARASDNALFLRFAKLVWGRFLQFYYKTVPMRARGVEPDTVNAHAAILQSIREQNPERARTLMHSHVLRGREQALKLYFGF